MLEKEESYYMITRLRNRITSGESQGGFTLIELLVVIIIIGILLAIAVPAYLKFRDRAAENAAKANLRAALPSVEAFYADNGAYTGMNIATLTASYDAGLKLNAEPTIISATSYCIQSDPDGTGPTASPVWKITGPGGNPAAGAC
jgi:prepilin-type N-terminal cleavage/methylation domain-containing protein